MKFGTIIADPPWNYNRTSGDKKLRGYSDKHYEPLSTADLAALPVQDVVADNAVLFLWTNGPFLADCSAQKIAEGWGFRPVTLMAWHKVQQKSLFGSRTHGGGVGYWFRGNFEPILVATRGRSYRWSEQENWSAEQTNALFEHEKSRHSQKPPYVHQLVEDSIYPHPWLEMFGRRARTGWTVIGDGAPGCEGEDIRASLERLREVG
jgi:N6-adenosine-specific RNA methylase IME4